jgi:hypothetical protein
MTLSLRILLFLPILLGGAAAGRHPQGSDSLGSCPAKEFSWWPGRWDYATPGYDPGVSVVTDSEGGCLLKEEYVDTHGQKQHTTIHYDAPTKRWERLVVDPFRTYHSSGSFAPDGSIAFYETPTDRETYRPADADHIHLIGEESKDGGRTWKLLFDATYTRRR